MFADVSQRNGTADKDVPLILSDMSPDIFLAMMEFVYTNCVTLTPKIVSIIQVSRFKLFLYLFLNQIICFLYSKYIMSDRILFSTLTNAFTGYLKNNFNFYAHFFSIWTLFIFEGQSLGGGGARLPLSVRKK